MRPLDVTYFGDSHVNNVHDAHLLCLGMFQDLCQRVVSVIATDGILFQVTKMNVCRNEDLESILIAP